MQHERKYYEYIINDGYIVHKMSGEPLDTSQGPKGTKWIFVMSTAKKLYAGKVVWLLPPTNVIMFWKFSFTISV